MAVVLNNSVSSDPHDLRRIVGTGFTNGDATFTWQVYLDADRPASFQTYCAIGPSPSFTGSNYYVAFDGSGGVSNAWAIGAGMGPGDTYDDNGNDEITLAGGPRIPAAGQWYQQAMRWQAVGGNKELTFYYDLAAGLTRAVRLTAIQTIAFDSTTTLVFGSNSWTTGEEGIQGKIRYAKAFTAGLVDTDLQLEAASPWLVTAAGVANVWAQWPLLVDPNDIAGNNRHLSANGFVGWDAEVAGPMPDFNPFPRYPLSYARAA